jgi:2-polyprenyl-6-methoxyphenol hydroxylase-like FAD-dependent oxidoreductase
MKKKTVLISGASIAGPALALWLTRYGYAVTVVERAPSVRPGGQAVDFKGATHRTVLERMGILDDVLARRTGGTDQTIIDAGGRAQAVIPGEFTGGDLEIRRGDLADILYEHTDCEYLFGDTITALAETPEGVDVTFAHGIHSNVRRLAFGPERDYVRFLGHYYALAELGEQIGGGEAVMYNEPGRMAAVGGPKASAFFVFASPELDYDRGDTGRQRQLVTEAYRGAGWRVPDLIAKLPDAREFYLDSLARVTIDHYSRGRVVLLGDAAYGNTLGGFGTGLAIVGAYVLAGELLAADGDHRVAFARYEEQFRGYAKISQRGSAGPFLAPPSPLRIKLRDWTFKSRFLLGLMLKATDKFATDIDLPAYPS